MFNYYCFVCLYAEFLKARLDDESILFVLVDFLFIFVKNAHVAYFSFVVIASATMGFPIWPVLQNPRQREPRLLWNSRYTHGGRLNKNKNKNLHTLPRPWRSARRCALYNCTLRVFSRRLFSLFTVFARLRYELYNAVRTYAAYDVGHVCDDIGS